MAGSKGGGVIWIGRGVQHSARHRARALEIYVIMEASLAKVQRFLDDLLKITPNQLH